MRNVNRFWVVITIVFAALLGMNMWLSGYWLLGTSTFLFLGGSIVLQPVRLQKPERLIKELGNLFGNLSIPALTLIFFIILRYAEIWQTLALLPWWMDLFFVALPEEAFFRRGVQGSLGAIKPPIFQITLATLIFVVFHLYASQDAFHLVRILAGGYIFSFLYWWRESLMQCVLMHALLNQVA